MKHKQAESWTQSPVNFSESHQPPRGFIGYLQVGIFIVQSRSLKDRRRIVEPIKQKARNNFNVSVGEKPSQMWKNCELFFICANYTKHCVQETIDRLEDFVRSYAEIQVVAIEKGVI